MSIIATLKGTYNLIRDSLAGEERLYVVWPNIARHDLRAAFGNQQSFDLAKQAIDDRIRSNPEREFNLTIGDPPATINVKIVQGRIGHKGPGVWLVIQVLRKVDNPHV